MELDTIIFQDCLVGMKEMADESIDLVCTDPPFFIGYQNQDWDKGNFQEFTNAWVKECVRLLKPTGTMWSFMGYENLFTRKGIPKGFINILEDYGNVNYKNMLIWAHSKGRGSSKALKSLREDCINFTKTDKYTWNPLKMLREVIAPYVKDGKPRGWFIDESGLRKRFTGLGNVMIFSAPQHNGIAEKQFHPSQKPVILLQRLIGLSSNEGDIVLDPFMGSGSTAIACKLMGRHFVGFENNEKYFDYAQKRIADFKREQYPGFNLKVDKEIKEYMDKLSKKEIKYIEGNIAKL
jgi:DNA modification methylase